MEAGGAAGLGESVKFEAELGGETIPLEVTGEEGRFRVVIGDEVTLVDGRQVAEGIWSILVDRASYVADVSEHDGVSLVEVDGETYAVRVEEETRYIIRTRGGKASARGQILKAPMPGKVVLVEVEIGPGGGARRRAHRAGGHEDGERVSRSDGGHRQGDPGRGRPGRQSGRRPRRHRVATRVMAHAIQFKDVDKWFGQLHVLAEVSLDVEAGEVIVVCGPSGSGKSTLIRCVNRLEPIQKGDILVYGESVAAPRVDLARLRAEVGMVFQSFNLFPHMTALENIMLAPVKVKGVSRAEAEKTARELLARVRIPDRADSYPANLSGGQQQRVAIARALAMQPKIMLFDEPTSALDPEMINEVLDVMTDLARSGMTMMVVTHEMGFARRVAHRVVFMDAGRIVEVQEPQAFFAAPRSDRAKEFLSKILSH